MLIGDRRLFHPLGFHRPAVLLDGRPVRRLVVRPVRSPSSRAVVAGARGSRVARAPLPSRQVPSGVAFPDPVRTMVCRRRARRREVLHALGFTGRGSGGGRKRRNYLSEVSC